MKHQTIYWFSQNKINNIPIRSRRLYTAIKFTQKRLKPVQSISIKDMAPNLTKNNKRGYKKVRIE